jgi:hypothetical protein
MALGSFDNIAIGTKLVKDSDPGTVYSVSDAGVRYEDGRLVTALILVKLGENGFRAATINQWGHKISSRKKTLVDSTKNRSEWTKV